MILSRCAGRLVVRQSENDGKCTGKNRPYGPIFPSAAPHFSVDRELERSYPARWLRTRMSATKAICAGCHLSGWPSLFCELGGSCVGTPRRTTASQKVAVRGPDSCPERQSGSHRGPIVRISRNTGPSLLLILAVDYLEQHRNVCTDHLECCFIQ